MEISGNISSLADRDLPAWHDLEIEMLPPQTAGRTAEGHGPKS